MFRNLATACGMAALVSGCATHQEIVDPATVTLEDALVGTVHALARTREESIREHTNFHFYGCTVQAVFNINATGTVGNKIALSATGGPPASIAPVSVSLSGSHEESETGTRGNTVTVLLATPDCLPNAKTEGAAGAPKSSKPSSKSGSAVMQRKQFPRGGSGRSSSGQGDRVINAPPPGTTE